MAGRLLTVAEAAERVRRDETTVRRWVRCGELVASRPGGGRGGLLIEEEAIDDLLERTRVEARRSATRTFRARSSPAAPTTPTVGVAGGSFRARARRSETT